MTTNLTLDSGTKRLLELASEPYSSDEDIQTILSIINTVAPSLLDGLTEGSCNRIARGLEVRCYPRNEVLFRQGDPPDAYYTVIRGAVSIYALSGDSSACSADAREGKFLCQLPPGSSFGELSFNANGIHSRRNAGVVSDGSHGQSKVMPLKQCPLRVQTLEQARTHRHFSTRDIGTEALHDSPKGEISNRR